MARLWDILQQRRKLFVLVGVTTLMVLVAAFAGNLWYESTYFISTENASVAGALVQVSSPNAGRIYEIRKDVGDVVGREEALAVVDIPISTNLPLGGARASFLDARDRLISVPSPAEGVVVNRTVNVGDTISSSQTLFTVVDTRNLWVVANVEETKIGRVHPGQQVEVYLDALHQTLDGVVETIIPASASTFSLLPAQNAAGNFTKVVQLVPVKITLRREEAVSTLIVGTSARVRIHLQQTSF